METKKIQRKRGFTIMELVVVISILAVIAAFAVPTFIRINQDAKMKKTVTDINTMGSAVVQKFHELAGMTSDWPTLANAKSVTSIQNNTVLYLGKEFYTPVIWGDLFSSRSVPNCPIDNQPYLINVISTGSVDYITTGSGTMMANVIDPEFQILWISQGTPPDTVSVRFRP